MIEKIAQQSEEGEVSYYFRDLKCGLISCDRDFLINLNREAGATEEQLAEVKLHLDNMPVTEIEECPKINQEQL